MAELRRNANEQRDFKERFEFKLTIGNNIICQRYFRINDFNPVSLSSYELAETIMACAQLIDNDLKSKSQIYLETVSPRIFSTKAEMKEYFSNEYNRGTMLLGEGIVIREDETNYVWGANNEPIASPTQFSDGELTKELTDEDRITYKLAFLDNGREVISTVWEGIYPKYIRKSIDLSNKGPRFENINDLYTVGFDTYLKYRLTEGRSDLVYKIIKDICLTCGGNTNDWYKTTDDYVNNNGEKVTYKNRNNERKNAR